MNVVRKTDDYYRPKLALIHGKAAQRDHSLPLTIKMFMSCMAAGYGFVMMQAANDDATSRWLFGIGVPLVTVLAGLVWRDFTRRIAAVEEVSKERDQKTTEQFRDLERKIEKAVRANTLMLTMALPEKAVRIAEVSEKFFDVDREG